MYIYFATQAACKRNTDVKKAFDSGSHSKLLIRLPAYGMSDNLLAWLAEFLCNRSQFPNSQTEQLLFTYFACIPTDYAFSVVRLESCLNDLYYRPTVGCHITASA